MTLFKLLPSLFLTWYSLKFVGETLPHAQRALSFAQNSTSNSHLDLGNEM